MFERMTGRQLAGWGYGIFWFGLLFETINCVLSALSKSPLASPVFWIGQALTVTSVVVSIRMLTMIHRKPW